MLVERFIPAQELPAFRFGELAHCCYCGVEPNASDHVIPVAMQHVHDQQRRTINGPYTPCCMNCNAMLSNKIFDSFQDRCAYVAARWTQLSKPVLWHRWEIQALEYTLRKFVEADRAKRLVTSNRADWFDTRDFYTNIEGLKWEVSSRVKEGSFLYNFFAETIRQINRRLYDRE